MSLRLGEEVQEVLWSECLKAVRRAKGEVRKKDSIWFLVSSVWKNRTQNTGRRTQEKIKSNKLTIVFLILNLGLNLRSEI